MADATDTNESNDSGIADKVVREARKRFERCAEWESNARNRFLDDVKFANGDADNGYQWPNAIRQARDGAKKPCLTMNTIRQHNLQIVNNLKQNKSAMTVRPAGNGATAESAQVLKALLRHIEYQSKAQSAYSTGAQFQVEGGIGWWRIATDYAGADSFDQEIYIRRVDDPLSIYMDPDCQELDCSDAKFAFVFDNVPKEEFDEAYPEFRDIASLNPMDIASGDDDWVTKDHVRVCEYFRKVQKADKAISFIGPNGKRTSMRGSRLPKEVRDGVLDHPLTKWRTVYDDVVEWKLIVADRVIDSTEWPTKYIPLIRVLGEETKIEGLLDRKGHTRAMKDAQRMYNYNASSQVEFVALQGKTPWIAPVKAIEEYESYWNSANVVDHSVLVWNHMDDDGNPIPPPMKPAPPSASMAYETGMTTAMNQMMMTSGQWQAQMGMMGNERTGAAMDARTAQGDTATFHFVDNYMDAIRATAVQIIELIPKVYDTKRILNIMAEDGTDLEIEIDPGARQAYLEQQGHNAEVVKRIFNPMLGRYQVEADTGPSIGTKREETVKALTLILTQAPALTGIVGDLLLQAMDFDKAQEAAQRLKRMVPAQALGKGPTQQEQLLQQQLQGTQQALAKALEKLGKDQLKLVGKDQMRDIDVYDAETKRFKALSDHLQNDNDLQATIHQLVGESLETHLTPILKANADGLESQSSEPLPGATSPETETPPMPGAAKAPDGMWYITDPTRKGKYLRIGGLAQQKAR